MKQIFTLLIALCWLLPSAHADVRRTEAKDSLLRIYLASPADTTRLETLYQIALLDQLSPTFIYYENKLLEEAIAQKNILTRVRPYMRTLFITTTYWTKNMQNNG
mgnify:FL=1